MSENHFPRIGCLTPRTGICGNFCGIGTAWCKRGNCLRVSIRLAGLRDGQGDGLAGSAASAAEVAGVSAWSVDGNAGRPWARDDCGCERDLQLGAAQDLRAQGCPVDNHD